MVKPKMPAPLVLPASVKSALVNVMLSLTITRPEPEVVTVIAPVPDKVLVKISPLAVTVSPESRFTTPVGAFQAVSPPLANALL